VYGHQVRLAVSIAQARPATSHGNSNGPPHHRRPGRTAARNRWPPPAVRDTMYYRTREAVMPSPRPGLASVNLGTAKGIGLRLVEEGRFENLSEACRAGLRRLAEDARIIDRLAALADEGMASDIDESFDIDRFVEEARAEG